MVVKLASAVRDAMMNAYEATIGVAPTLSLYSGAPPANVTDAATGTLIASITLPSDWMGASSSGVISKAGTWTTNAVAAGTIGYYRITKASTTYEQGTVAASSADMIVDNPAVVLNQTITVNTFTKTAAGA